MINLLPPEQKQKLLQEDKLRVTLVLGTVFFYFLISLSLALLLVKQYSLWNLETRTVLLDEKSKMISLNQDTEKQIKEANNFFSDLSSFYEKSISVTSVLEKLESRLPAGIYLTSFDFVGKRIEKDKSKVSVGGHSLTRDILLALQENLKQEEDFSDIEFSPSCWVKPEDIDCTITFNLEN